MKKFLTIMLVAITAVMLSSCVIVTSESTPTYTMYFKNDTNNYVHDWYVKNKNDYIPYKDSPARSVAPNETSSISGLSKDYYQIWYKIYSTGDTEIFLYTENFVYLDTDTIFYLSDLSFHSRSIDNDTNNNFVLRTADGQELELKSCVFKK